MPADNREIRILYGTTPSTTYTAPNAAGWNPGTASLIQGWVDDSKLVQPGIPKRHMSQRFYSGKGFAPGREDSELSIGMYSGLAVTDAVTAPFEATLLSKFFGGLSNPASVRKFDAGGGTHTTTKVYVAAHDITAGMGVLINGEARRVASVDTTYIELEMALSAAPSDGDDVVIANTVYLDQSADVNYLDTLIMGHHAEDQIQTLAGMGPVTLEGLGNEDLLSVLMNLTVPHWRESPSGDRETAPISFAETPDNGNTAPSLGNGAVYFGDWGVTTRNVIDCDEVKIDPGLAFAMATSGGNFTGFKRTRGVPTCGFKTYVDSDFGLHADFNAQTEKQALFQFGNVAGGCVFITLPRLRLSKKPDRATISDMRALELELEALEPTVAASPVNSYSYSFGIHWC